MHRQHFGSNAVMHLHWNLFNGQVADSKNYYKLQVNTTKVFCALMPITPLYMLFNVRHINNFPLPPCIKSVRTVRKFTHNTKIWLVSTSPCNNNNEKLYVAQFQREKWKVVESGSDHGAIHLRIFYIMAAAVRL